MGNKWVSGKRRGYGKILPDAAAKPTDGYNDTAVRGLTGLGIGMLCLLLIGAMRAGGDTGMVDPFSAEAVAVMQTVETREELVLPDRETAAENRSVFEEIGAFFAELLFGAG